MSAAAGAAIAAAIANAIKASGAVVRVQPEDYWMTNRGTRKLSIATDWNRDAIDYHVIPFLHRLKCRR